MLIRRFLTWVETAPAEARASAVTSLVRAYLSGGMEPIDQEEAPAALLVLTRDPAEPVRRAMAQELAHSPMAPAEVVAALAADASDIATLVLASSPVLSEADLIERAASGDAAIQCAIARRQMVSAPLSAALSEVADADALLILLGNSGATVLDFSLARIAERHGSEPAIKAALLECADLPDETRAVLIGREEPASDDSARDEAEKSVLSLARLSPDADMPALARHLRQSGHLTASLLLRAVIAGETRLMAAALAELTGEPLKRTAALMSRPKGPHFAALIEASGLPIALLPHIAMALEVRLAADPLGIIEDATLTRRTVAAVMAIDEGTDAAIGALLRGIDADALAEEARFVAGKGHAAALAAMPAEPPALRLPAAAQLGEVVDRTSLYDALTDQILSGRAWGLGLPAATPNAPPPVQIEEPAAVLDAPKPIPTRLDQLIAVDIPMAEEPSIATVETAGDTLPDWPVDTTPVDIEAVKDAAPVEIEPVAEIADIQPDPVPDTLSVALPHAEPLPLAQPEIAPRLPAWAIGLQSVEAALADLNVSVPSATPDRDDTPDNLTETSIPAIAGLSATDMPIEAEASDAMIVDALYAEIHFADTDRAEPLPLSDDGRTVDEAVPAEPVLAAPLVIDEMPAQSEPEPVFVSVAAFETAAEAQAADEHTPDLTPAPDFVAAQDFAPAQDVEPVQHFVPVQEFGVPQTLEPATGDALQPDLEAQHEQQHEQEPAAEVLPETVALPANILTGLDGEDDFVAEITWLASATQRNERIWSPVSSFALSGNRANTAKSDGTLAA